MTINIERKLPVINGFVSIPDGQTLAPTSLTPEDVLALIPGSTLTRIGASGQARTLPISSLTYSANNDDTQRRDRDQMWIVLPAYAAPGGTPSDWFDTLRDAAGI
jgi:hypothetical protein